MVYAKEMAAVAAALLSTGAFAADFENHLTSTPMVSPAQLYQISNIRTDFALGYLSGEQSLKFDGGDSKVTTTDTALFAAGIYNIPSIDLRAGLSVNYLTGAVETSVNSDAATEGDTELDRTAMIVTPQVAYPVGPVVLGAALDVYQETLKPEEGKEQKGSRNVFRPGALFVGDKFEAGLTYVSPNNTKAEEEDELDQVNPAAVLAHGRYSLDDGLAVGGIVANVHHKGLDEDLYKDQTQVKATTEYTAGAIKVDGGVGYNSAFHKNDDAMSTATIGTYAIDAGADYSVNKGASVGGALGYEFGSDKSDGIEYAVNDLSFAIRGDVRF